MNKYKYVGDVEVHLPEFGITVKKGEIVTSEKSINNPDFKLVTSEDEERVKNKK